MRDLESLLRVRGGASLRDRLITTGVVARGRPRTFWFRAVPNFGDQIGPAVLAWATGRKPVWVSRRVTGKVLCVGSILQALARNDIVWGSGAIQDRPIDVPDGVRFLAVRGPLTRGVVEADVPPIYGDPALLLPRFHDEPAVPAHDIGLVPHHLDLPHLGEVGGALVIDVRASWQAVVARIRSCRLILSSSLHGLIVAEAYGIPAVWITMGDRLKGGTFKFNDYYLGTGRARREPVPWSGDPEALALHAAPPLAFDPEPLVGSIRALRDALFGRSAAEAPAA